MISRSLRRLTQGARLEVLIALLTRGIGLALSTGTILALTLLASPSEQGYYFSFLSLVALSQIADIGLTTVVSQFVAHERAHLTEVTAKGLAGPSDHVGKIASLVRLATYWYSALAALLVVVLLIAGFQLFGARPSEVQWATPWVIAAIAAAVDFLTLPLIAVLFGLGFVRSVYILRAVKAIAMAAALWSALAAGLGLLGVGLATAAGTIAALTFILVKYGRLFQSLLADVQLAPIRWREEMLPMQWRIAVSWFSGYFVFQTLTPIAFYLKGPVLSGQVGATAGLLQAILSLSVTVMESQQTKLGVMVARHEPSTDRTAFRFGALAVALGVLGVAGCVTILFGIDLLGLSLADRFLPAGVAAVLLFSAVPHCAVSSIAIYLRAHKREPFMGISVLAAMITAPCVYVSCLLGGGLGLSLGFTGVAVFFSLPAALWILRRCLQAWRRQPLASTLTAS